MHYCRHQIIAIQSMMALFTHEPLYDLSRSLLFDFLDHLIRV